MRIIDLIGAADIRSLVETDAAGVVRELGLGLAPRCSVDGERLVEMLLRREKVASTAVGNGLAIPHARSVEAGGTVAVMGLSPGGVAFGAPDGLPVHVFVAMVSPIHGGRHLQAMACIARELGDPALCRRLAQARDAAERYGLLSRRLGAGSG
jgi:mannitol/fructose-specific phosphotransferase system IIA component (Ntr-type)